MGAEPRRRLRCARRLAPLAGVLVGACMGPGAPAAPPPHPVPADGSIHVQTRQVPLNPKDPAQLRLGDLTYAGGLELTSDETSRLHGVSGIDIAADGVSFIANTDEGDLLTGRLVLGADGRLAGVAQAKLQPLRDEAGHELQGKAEGDAEDITYLPDGGFAVSFERDHRILAYRKPGGPARLVWRHSAADTDLKLGDNSGIEALTAGADGSLVMGSEDADIRRLVVGRVEPAALGPAPPAGYKLTALDGLAGEDWLAVYRAYDPVRGGRAVIATLPQPRCIRAPCVAPHGLVELARIGRGLTVDNFEGVAAVPRPSGGWRIYIVSDDNFSASERTLLLAFDWDPHKR